MLFRIVNNLVIFQRYINSVLCNYLNLIYITYLNNILIYSKNAKTHMQDIRKVLEHLLKHELFVKLEIYIFNSSKINFLGFVLTNKGAKMDLN